MKFSFKSVCVPCFAAMLLLVTAGVQAKQNKAGGQTQSAKQYAPGQQKRAQNGSKSAKQYAPGQQKKTQSGSKSAKQYAPGQQKKSTGNP